MIVDIRPRHSVLDEEIRARGCAPGRFAPSTLPDREPPAPLGRNGWTPNCQGDRCGRAPRRPPQASPFPPRSAGRSAPRSSTRSPTPSVSTSGRCLSVGAGRAVVFTRAHAARLRMKLRGRPTRGPAAHRASPSIRPQRDALPRPSSRSSPYRGAAEGDRGAARQARRERARPRGRARHRGRRVSRSASSGTRWWRRTSCCPTARGTSSPVPRPCASRRCPSAGPTPARQSSRRRG